MSHEQHPDSAAGRIIVGAAIGAGVLAAAALAAGALAVAAARAVVTPPTRREQDVRILSHDEHTITLSVMPGSVTPGRYTLWFSHEAGHARIGDVISRSATSVTRELLAVDFGDLASARMGRVTGWYYLSPEEFGHPWQDVEIETELGPAPAWLIPAAEPTTRWAIHVHGRAVRREETLRGVPVFREAGFTSLLVSYRNDGDAPASADGRYALGAAEWRDLEAAMRFALDHGAKEIVLFGWSMGGAISLQTLTQSELADAVIGVALDSPVIDWVTALHYQAALNRLPRFVGVGAMVLLRSSWALPLTGSAEPIDLGRLDLVTRARELDVPVLIMHSEHDGYVPITASRALAVTRPDIVTFVPFREAQHTRLWNFDPNRWNTALRTWLGRLPRR